MPVVWWNDISGNEINVPQYDSGNYYIKVTLFLEWLVFSFLFCFVPDTVMCEFASCICAWGENKKALL